MDVATELTPAPVEPAKSARGPRSKHDHLAQARFMSLENRPVSADAGKLVDTVFALVEGWETKTSARVYQRREGKRRQFRIAVGAVVGDLVLAADRNPDCWAYRTMAAGSFSDVSYKHFRSVFQALKGLELVEVVLGFYERTEGWTQGKATRLRASPALLSLFHDHGVQPGEAMRHFQAILPSRPLVLKASSVRRRHRKTSGQRMRITPTDRSRQLEADVREIDLFIAKHELRGGTHRGYRRIFNCGDVPAFDWNKGGRLYSVGENSYQRLSKKDRLRMRINGEPVAEIDVRASYLTILHALREVPLDAERDPYAVHGLPRPVVKAWVTMTLGHDKFHRRWPKDMVEALREEGIEVRRDHPVKQVERRVIKALPVLEDWPECTVMCFDLMYRESVAVVNTMLRLKREAKVVSLSIHDSLLVPYKSVELAEKVLAEEYQRVVGVRPGLRTNFPPSDECPRLLAPPGSAVD